MEAKMHRMIWKKGWNSGPLGSGRCGKEIEPRNCPEPGKRVISVICITGMLIVAGPACLPLIAQDVGYSISPGLVLDDDGRYAAALNWRLDLAPQPRIRPSLEFPSELWYELGLSGSVLTRADASVMPVGRGVFDLGWRVSLSAQHPFDMQDPDRELQIFDYGYLFIGMQGMAEIDQPMEEAVTGFGAVLNYRRPGLYRGLRPLVPNLTVGYAYNQPVQSQVHDNLNAGLDSFQQLDLGAFWTYRSVYAVTPGWFNNLRLMGGINYYQRFGVEDVVEEEINESGIYYHFDLGFELSGVSRFLNYVFVRYSGGEYPVIYEDRRQWMVGIVISNRD
jgi:hypothetical protein